MEVDPSKEITLEFKSWSHTCGDGCCYTYGTDIFINGLKVSDSSNDDLQVAVIEVLESLGYIIKEE